MKTERTITNAEKWNFRLPYIVSLVLIFQVPLQIVVMNNIHLYILILAIGYLIFQRIKKPLVFKASILFVPTIVVLWIFLSTIFLPSIIISIIGGLDYLLPILFWSLYLYSYSEIFDIHRYSRFIIALITVMAVFGIYQRFVDPSLFGIMNRVNAYNTMETMQYVSTFRVSSFMSASTLYSLTVGFGTALLIEEWYNYKSSFLKYIMLIIQVVGGLLAAGKMYVFVAGIAFIISYLNSFFKKRNRKMKTKEFAVLISTVLLIAILVTINKDRIQALTSTLETTMNRIFLFFVDKSAFYSQESGRMGYMQVLFQSKPAELLLGHGLGTSSYSANNTLGHLYNIQRVTLESYALSWWYEMGIIGFICFISFFGVEAIRSFLSKDEYCATKIALFLAMFFSPVFYSISLLPIWCLFVYPIYTKGKRNRFTYR